ncbi:MAG: c-type cytochrome [Cytophagaceae bacterium]
MKKLIPILFFLAIYNMIYAQDIAEGEKLYNSSCKACHSIGKGAVVGPDLANVHERRSAEWLKKFIKSPSAMIGEGDAEAVKLFEEFNKIMMPDQSFLSDADINNLIAFITEKSSAKEEPVAVADKSTSVIEASVPSAGVSGVSTVVIVLLGITIALVVATCLLIMKAVKLISAANRIK